MKELTKEEITKLAEEYAELDRWNEVKAWAEKYYGACAAKVEVEIAYHFNDGDPEYPSVDDVSVYDASGDRCIGKFDDFDENGEESDYYEAKAELPATPESAEYDLTTEPPLSFPCVVVLDGGEVVVKLYLAPNTSFTSGGGGFLS